MDNLKDLVKEFGQDYNYVLFIDGENLVICSVDDTEPSVHTEIEKLESVVYEIHSKGLSVRLVYYESFATKSEAMKRECAIKKLTRSQKLALIAAASNECN